MAAWLYTSAEDGALDGVQVLELDQLAVAERDVLQPAGAHLLHEVVPRLAQRDSDSTQLDIRWRGEARGGRGHSERMNNEAVKQAK